MIPVKYHNFSHSKQENTQWLTAQFSPHRPNVNTCTDACNMKLQEPAPGPNQTHKETIKILRTK